VPSAIEQVRRVLAIPAKRTTVPVVPHLSTTEMRALLDAPDLATRSGIRDVSHPDTPLYPHNNRSSLDSYFECQ